MQQTFEEIFFFKSNKNTSSQSTVILNETIKAHIKPILQ